MQKPFNSLVVFVRNGVATPAFVVKSQLQADGREFLSLLYADPITGPQLVLAGATRKVGDVALSVPPLSVGANFGWEDVEAADLRAWKAKPKPTIEELEAILNSEGEFPIKINPDGSISAVAPFKEGNTFGWKDTEVETVTLANLPPSIAIYVKKLEDELAETTEGRDKALQEMADAGAVKRTAPEQLDEAQGAVEPGAPESPHAPGFASFHVAENEDGTLESHPGSYPENNPPSDSEREIAVQKSLAVQE